MVLVRVGLGSWLLTFLSILRCCCAYRYRCQELPYPASELVEDEVQLSAIVAMIPHFNHCQLGFNKKTQKKTTDLVFACFISSVPLHFLKICTALHALRYTTLHYPTLHYTALHYTTLHYTTLHYHYTTLHNTPTLHCTPLHSTPLHFTPLHSTTLHTTLTPLHSTTTLHDTTRPSYTTRCTTRRDKGHTTPLNTALRCSGTSCAWSECPCRPKRTSTHSPTRCALRWRPQPPRLVYPTFPPRDCVRL